jgi:hypothetical protein|tara:strand:- start:6014 stop:6655 length:642 start_codon:yes stop_codon:yes gene_type:complete
MGHIDEAIQVKNVLDFYNIDNFVETGTGKAEVVQSISKIKSNLNIHTIEIMEEIYNENKISHSYLTNVNWHLGQSSEVMPEILPQLEGNTLFWLDAHFPGADFGLASYGDEQDFDKRLPLRSELELIVKGRNVSDDIFVIDDLRIYEDGPFESGNWADRKLYGGNDITFIEDLFDDTHFVVRSYNKQGFVILLPITKDISDEVENLIVGTIDE